MTPLLKLRGVRREYFSGEEVFSALKDVDLDVHAGEYIAIIGPSGSGKSTLMNIFGCLDRPTTGTYLVAGRVTADMSSNELAQLRSKRFGFIFQRYNLLNSLTALANVELPGVYSGEDRIQRKAKAEAVLTRMGLGDRLCHRPVQLSGGEQQRVSIARALMNGGEIILADEPTGALDCQSGENVLDILKDLNALGHTIIIVTHDLNVARHADRIVELHGGVIVADRELSVAKGREPAKGVFAVAENRRCKGVAIWYRVLNALHIALASMKTHRLRTALTMLGIVIGIAAVVSVVALGAGTQEKVLQSIGALGTNTLEIRPGAGYGDMRADRIRTLRAADAVELASLPFVDSATPGVSVSATVRYGSLAANAQVYGVGNDYFRVKGMRVIEGSIFDAQAVDRMDQSVVLEEYGRNLLVGNAHDNPIGKVILLGKVPVRVVGIVKPSGTLFSGTNLSVWAPYTTVMTRMLGQSYVESVTVRISDNTPMRMAEETIARLVSRLHGSKDFFVQSTSQIREAIESSTKAMTWFIGSVAAIALLVGGIGVMNIMLVSVTERTREIGVRLAVGARQSDIQQQFLVEAVLVCLMAGAIGVLLAVGLGILVRYIDNENFQMIFSFGSIVAAFVFSTMIGATFGFLPARNAARLDPVDALGRE